MAVFHIPWVNDSTGFEATDMNAAILQLDDRLVELSETIYDIGGSFENVPVGSEVILRFPLPRDITFPVDMGDSRIVAGTPATAASVISFRKNNIEFATATFAIGATAGVMSGSLTDFAAGDILTIVCATAADLTLGNLGWCLSGIRTVLVP